MFWVYILLLTTGANFIGDAAAAGTRKKTGRIYRIARIEHLQITQILADSFNSESVKIGTERTEQPGAAR
jgi:hypothetical protein